MGAAALFANGEKYENNKKIISVYSKCKYGARGVWIDAFAKTEEDVSKTETNTSGIEANKSYLVPLTFYDVTGELIRDYGGLGGIPEFIDNVAIVSKNSDDTYHVTLQIENYNKIDVLQFSKPGLYLMKQNRGMLFLERIIYQNRIFLKKIQQKMSEQL